MESDRMNGGKNHADSSGGTIASEFALKSLNSETLRIDDMTFHQMLLDISQLDEEIVFDGTPRFRPSELHPYADELYVDRMLETMLLYDDRR